MKMVFSFLILLEKGAKLLAHDWFSGCLATAYVIENLLLKFSVVTFRVDLSQVVFLSDEVGQTTTRLFERRSREETTCLACMDSNLICILLAGNYCDGVMDAL